MVIPLLISLLGLPAGILLAYMTKEELVKGKKYFLILRYSFYSIIGITTLIFFLQDKLFLRLFLFIILASVIISVELITKNKYFQNFSYILFFITYFLNSNEIFQVIFASLIFIYGLPTGTLIYHEIKKGS